jgi:AcrR family transcriptional regulator
MRSTIDRTGAAINIQRRPTRSLPNKGARIVLRRAHTEAAGDDDRRVRRTRQALIRALIELVHEKRYDAITIQNLLDRADVGRSTFYAHYRGKDDLLLRSFEGLLQMLDRALDRGGAPGGQLAPVRELFGHIGEMREFHRALVRAHMLDRVYQAGANCLSRTIARRLAAEPGGGDKDAAEVAALAHGLAGALFGMLRWWVDNEAPLSPERMDELYHAIRVAPQAFPSPAIGS